MCHRFENKLDIICVEPPNNLLGGKLRDVQEYQEGIGFGIKEAIYLIKKVPVPDETFGSTE